MFANLQYFFIYYKYYFTNELYSSLNCGINLMIEVNVNIFCYSS